MGGSDGLIRDVNHPTIPCETLLLPSHFCQPHSRFHCLLSQGTSLVGCPTDLDGDGVVGMSDLLIVLADFGTHCDEPPASVGPYRAHFTELHYNPASVQGSDMRYEFLELYNPDTAPLTWQGGPL